MRKWLCLPMLLFTALCVSAQADTALLNDTRRFQGAVRTEYENPNTTPLSVAARKKFKGIHFYPFNTAYAVVASFVRTPREKPFQMNTSSGMRKTYVKYGYVLFSLDGKEYKLNVYQAQELLQSIDYKDYLLIPFTDATSGDATYRGGRYLDLTIPAGDEVLINFNKAYHPYCAYTEGYNCPIPPPENHLPVKIEAGVRF